MSTVVFEVIDESALSDLLPSAFIACHNLAVKHNNNKKKKTSMLYVIPLLFKRTHTFTHGRFDQFCLTNMVTPQHSASLAHSSAPGGVQQSYCYIM